MASVIDKLPEATRQEVINALLSGKALREVAKIAGISHQAVDKYKRQKFLPTLAVAQKLNAEQGLQQSPEQQITSIATLTKTAIAAEPIRNRIAEHQKTLDAAISDARKDKDSRGVAALIRTDLSGLELDAKLTGLLDGPSHVTVNNLAIVMSPKSEALEPAIDVHCEPVSDSSEPAE